jgi:magnesium transporter
VLRAWEIDEQGIEAIAEPTTISTCLGRSSLVWVDLTDPSDDELATLSDEFGLHPLWINDVRDAGQRPKLEVFETHAFIVGYAHDEDPTDLPEVGIFFSANWLVTVRQKNRAGRCFAIDDAQEFYERIRDTRTDVGLLLYALLDDMVDGYFDTVDAAEDRISAVEEIIFADPPEDDRIVQQDMLRVRRALIELRRHVAPMRDVVLGLLRREVPWTEGDTLVYLQDVLDRLLRVIDGIDVQRELLGNVVDAQLGLQSNRMNGVLK